MAVQIHLLSVRNLVLVHRKILHLAWYHKRTWKLMPLARNSLNLPRQNSEALVLKRIKNCGKRITSWCSCCFMLRCTAIPLSLVASFNSKLFWFDCCIDWTHLAAKGKRNRNYVEWLLGCVSRASWSLLAGGFPLHPGRSCRRACLNQMLRLCW